MMFFLHHFKEPGFIQIISVSILNLVAACPSGSSSGLALWSWGVLKSFPSLVLDGPGME